MPLKKYTGKVIVTQLVLDEELDPEDREENPAGEHIVEAVVGDGDMIMESLLQEFHETVAIAKVDDFDVQLTSFELVSGKNK